MEFHHVGISVADIQRSIRFYRDLLDMNLDVPPFPNEGADVESVMGLTDVRVQTCILSRGSMRLELFEFRSPDPQELDPNYSVANRGISHFGITVPDIAASYARLKKAGVRFHAEVTRFRGGIQATYGRDPDGNVFELLEMPAAA